jgi:SAM-dependent methyltransferase
LQTEYVDPLTGQHLAASGNTLLSPAGKAYQVISLFNKSIPIFTDHAQLGEAGMRSLAMYGDSTSAAVYRNFLNWLFKTFEVDEREFRRSLIAKLCLKDGDRVLITGCGLGDDVFPLLDMFGERCTVYASDLSLEMVAGAAGELEKRYPQARVELFAADASSLPFNENFFDAVFHFGGINLFDNPKLAISEMTRVAKAGGRIVFGDEGVAPWLRETEYARMVIANNHLWAANALIDQLPFAAVEASISWVLGNCFYVIRYVKSAAGPHVNPDVEHLGRRGGSMRTRYFGQLEGVSPELKEAVEVAAKDSNLSVHSWLERAIKSALPK